MRSTIRLGSRTTTRRPGVKLRLQALEDRALPSFGFGSALGIGGTGGDGGTSVVVDAAGSMYVSGFYNGTVNFDPNNTNPDSNHTLTATDPTRDGFVAKYLADGTFQWATDLGPGAARPSALLGSGVFVPHWSPAPTANAATGYVSRLDAGTGAVTWTTTVIADGRTEAVAVSPTGNLYAGGYGSTAVVDRLDPSSGNILWSQTSSGGGMIDGLSADGSGNVFAAGSYSGTITFGSTTLTSYSGVDDAVVWKLNANGTSIWAGTIGGANYGTFGMATTTDGSGNVYMTGFWGGGTNNFNPGSGKAVSLPFHGGWDVFIVKLAPGKNGAMQMGWAKDIGGSGYDFGNAVAVDGAGNVYTTGSFQSTVNFNPNSGKAQNLSGGGVFVSKLDANGNYVAAVGAAGTADGTGGGGGSFIALDGSDNVYTTGNFSGTVDFDPTGGTYNLTSNGGSDIFVSKLTQAMTPSAGAPPSGGSDGRSASITAIDLSAVDLPEAGLDRVAAGKSKGGLFVAWLDAGR